MRLRLFVAAFSIVVGAAVSIADAIAPRAAQLPQSSSHVYAAQASGTAQARTQPSSPGADSARQTIDKYCAGCHNSRTTTEATATGIAFDRLDLSRIGAEAELWEKVHAAFQSTTRPPDRRLLLTTLGAFGDPVLARRSLDALYEPGVRPTEFGPWIAEATSEELGKELVFDWVRADYPKLTDRIAAGAIPFLVRQLGGVSKEREAAVAAWFCIAAASAAA